MHPVVLLRIINDILDYSKIEAGKIELDEEQFEIRPFLHAVARPLMPAASEKALELLINVTPDVPATFLADTVRLRQILTNLISNALKFTHQGEVELAVTRDATHNRLRFQVRDTGIGIPPEKQQLIFESFSQADTSTTRKYGGTGLGLTISARLVEWLWWPVGYGKPHLYQVSATLRDDRGVMDRRSSRTGLRKVEALENNQGWRINDRRIFVRGTNYLGSPWLSTMNKARYLRDFTLVEKMNANAIRVHGHVAGRALYEAADERGLLIWQDVPLQWGYNDSAAFADNAVAQTRAMTAQFGNSPAIVVWGGQNEPPFNSPWMEKRFPDWHKDLNRTLTRRVADALAEDRSRIVHPYSAVEEHYWAGWYFGTLNNLLEPAKTATVTEFGAQALPDLATLKTIIPRREWWPASTEPGDPLWTRWKYHNFQPIQTFKNAGISRGKNIQDFIKNTQRYQAQLAGHGGR
ncbi:ATP-binding protein [Pantoea eucrina]|uniref:ATP-binding protein n=1 Tax=Pantoea eucrina TaxID=472693 RepID=UPI000B8C9B8B